MSFIVDPQFPLVPRISQQRAHMLVCEELNRVTLGFMGVNEKDTPLICTAPTCTHPLPRHHHGISPPSSSTCLTLSRPCPAHSTTIVTTKFLSHLHCTAAVATQLPLLCWSSWHHLLTTRVTSLVHTHPHQARWEKKVSSTTCPLYRFPPTGSWST